jgi:hypothetical protein
MLISSGVLMVERGISLAHTTIMRLIARYTRHADEQPAGGVRPHQYAQVSAGGNKSIAPSLAPGVCKFIARVIRVRRGAGSLATDWRLLAAQYFRGLWARYKLMAAYCERQRSVAPLHQWDL